MFRLGWIFCFFFVCLICLRDCRCFEISHWQQLHKLSQQSSPALVIGAESARALNGPWLLACLLRWLILSGINARRHACCSLSPSDGDQSIVLNPPPAVCRSYKLPHCHHPHKNLTQRHIYRYTSWLENFYFAPLTTILLRVYHK